MPSWRSRAADAVRTGQCPSRFRRRTEIVATGHGSWNGAGAARTTAPPFDIAPVANLPAMAAVLSGNRPLTTVSGQERPCLG